MLHLLLREQRLTFSQFMVLAGVSSGFTTPSSLASTLKVTVVSISDIASRLLESALLTSSLDSKDRRVHRFALTELGQSKVNAILAG